MSTEVEVGLGQRSYAVRIGTGLLAQLGTEMRAAGLTGQVLVVTDSNVGALYGTAVLKALQAADFVATLVEVPAGESSKCQEQLALLYDRAVEAGLDRRGVVVALGGGVVGDLAGFLAASFLRGLRLVQVPTSLLAMVDSSVGGKTGINLPQGKNLVGAFHQPALVVADLEALRTLPPREFSAGMAEVIKYGVIRDAELFGLLEEQAEALRELKQDVLTQVVARSCAIKAEVVAQDEREGGLRAILNYGHTLGHAVEAVTGYRRYLHGEALGIGMSYAARLSARVLGFSAAEVARQQALIERFALPTHDTDLDWSALRAAMSLDKKSVAAVPRFVLARALGDVAFGCEVAEAEVESAWRQN